MRKLTINILGILAAAAVGITLGYIANPGQQSTQSNWKTDDSRIERTWNSMDTGSVPTDWNSMDTRATPTEWKK